MPSNLEPTSGLNVQDIDGEPRVLDLDLAVRLEFREPRMIRPLIKRHPEALERFGVCYTEQQTSGPQGGRPAEAYYLNVSQCIFVTAKSETVKATDITVEVVKRFDEYERGARRSLSPAEALIAHGQAMLAVERRQAELDAVQQDQERRLAVNERALQQIETATDWFTAIGYAKWAKNTSLDTQQAARLGRYASKLAKSLGVTLSKVPDGRYGRVSNYPKAILDAAWDEVFGGAH